MKRLICTALAAGIALGTACKRDGDVLASYDTGRITRGEFYEWIGTKQSIRDTIFKSKKQQRARLEMMAIQRFAVEEARRAGLDRSEDFLALSEMATNAQLIETLFLKEIKEKTKLKERAVHVRHIVLRVKDFRIDKGKTRPLSPAELEQERNATMARAGEIIARLEKGESFEELAKKYSEDSSKKKGGDIGFIVEDMMPPEYSRVAFSLKKGSYSKDPVFARGAVYIIMAVDDKLLSERNIEKLIKDKMQVSRIMNRFYAKASREYLDRLAAAPDVEAHLERATSANEKELLFKIGNDVYTVGDLNARIKRHSRRHMKAAAPGFFTPDQKRSWAENFFFRYELLRREALRRGYDKDPDFMRKLNVKKEAMLAGEYMKRIGAVAPTITESEIREEYEKNRERRYFSYSGKDKTQKLIEPLARVRERIRKMLENKRQAESVRQWREATLRQRSFKIVESELEGD